MHDLGHFRANFDAVAARLATRSNPPSLDTFRDLDARRRAAIRESEELKARRNSESAGIAALRKQGVDTSEQQKVLREIGDRISALEEQAATLDKEFQELLAGIPNLPHESVPVGRGAEENVEVRRCGEPRAFGFAPKPHWDLGPELGILDMERAAKITGARFAVYWGMGAKLERALINFMLDTHTREHGYTEVLPPFLINSASLYGTGQLPKFAEDLFKCEGHDLWLAPTAEVPVTNLYRDEVLPFESLPISLCAYTPCFRSEAGSYGRDVRGIIRQHQFQKVELVKFTRPEQSYAELEKLTADAESILRKLGLPFRTIVLSTGDMGFASAKTYDIEVWLPGLNEFKEISSCSNYESFQARRAGIRFKGAKGKSEFAHTLNGSGLAIGRTWLAIIENYQRADGAVEVPEVLRPYLNAETIQKHGELEMKLQGKNTLVTGASSGIGQAIAVRFAEEGANVAINYHRGAEQAELTLAMAQKANPGGKYFTMQADVSQEGPVQALFARTLESFGSLDVLVNNAGIQKPAPSHEIEAADFDRIIGVNLRGPFLCAREAIRHFLTRKGGVILNNSSVHEIIPKPKYLSYSISKGGMENLTKSLALEYADRGIRVNAVGPGAIVTPINNAWIDNPKARGEVESHIPMGRAGAASEMAAIFAFLASDEASYITGQTIFACGGLTLYPEFRVAWASGE